MMLLLKMMTGQRLQEKLVQCITSRSKTIPVVKVTKVKREQSPKDPYV